MLSQDDIGSIDKEDDLSSLTEITKLVGHQLKGENERKYLIQIIRRTPRFLSLFI